MGYLFSIAAGLIGGVASVSFFPFRAKAAYPNTIAQSVEITLITGKISFIVQAVIGALIVLAVEFVSGCILNLWLGLGVWDYSNQPGNVLGQICPAFGLLWFFIMPFAIWAEDTTRWTIWNYECLVYGWTESPPEVAPYITAGTMPGARKNPGRWLIVPTRTPQSPPTISIDGWEYPRNTVSRATYAAPKIAQMVKTRFTPCRPLPPRQ